MRLTVRKSFKLKPFSIMSLIKSTRLANRAEYITSSNSPGYGKGIKSKITFGNTMYRLIIN